MMRPIPCARTRSTISRPRRVCSTPSAANGSSSITSLPPQWTKRLSSIAWRWPPDRCSTRTRSEGMLRAAGGERLRRLRLHVALAQDRDAEHAPGQLAPHEEIRDDVDIRAERQVLVDGFDAGCLRLGRRREVALDAVEDRRARRSAVMPPAMILTSVDFPAPLSPRRATTSPRLTAKLTSRSASIAPKCLEIPSSRSSGAATLFASSLTLTVPALRSVPKRRLRLCTA